jgi:DNA-binding response OmpR family regulator
MSETRPPVCVVDDDASMRESVESLIRSADIDVETFASAQEFLARSPAALPSCLVLDVKLPGLSGLDLQQELARANVHVPIIFLTGCGDIPMSVRAIKAGALYFFTKPFDDEALLAAVRTGIASRGRGSGEGDAREGPDLFVRSKVSVAAADEPSAPGSLRLVWTPTPSGLRCRWASGAVEQPREEASDAPGRHAERVGRDPWRSTEGATAWSS